MASHDLQAQIANMGRRVLLVEEALGSSRAPCYQRDLLFILLIGRHLVGVWIGGVWNGHFPESEKYFSEAEFSRKIPEIPQKERFCQISGSEI